MNEVHVEAVRLQPREARVDLLEDVPPRESPIVRPGSNRVEYLRADKKLLPNGRPFRLEPPADVRFAAAAPVRIRGVEEVDPGVERAIHQVERLRFCLAHAEEGRRRADAAEVAAPKTQA